MDVWVGVKDGSGDVREFRGDEQRVDELGHGLFVFPVCVAEEGVGRGLRRMVTILIDGESGVRRGAEGGESD